MVRMLVCAGASECVCVGGGGGGCTLRTVSRDKILCFNITLLFEDAKHRVH